MLTRGGSKEVGRNESGKERILFVCINNSARSQMAEGLVNHGMEERYVANSAGSHPSTVNPFAIQVMKEIGIDISSYRSKGLKEFEGEIFDYVITVCGDGGETCPFFPGGRTYVHRGFEDPAVTDDSEETLANFRRVRDEIHDWLMDIL